MFQSCHISKNLQQIRHLNKKLPSSSAAWVSKRLNDPFTKLAQENGYRSRAAYKVKEINKKYHVFDKRTSQNIVDLGAAPGAWCQVAKEESNRNSKILGIDLLEIKPLSGVSFMQANMLLKSTMVAIRDFFNNADVHKINNESLFTVDVVMSDMLHNLTSIRFKDHLKSLDLCNAGLVVCFNVLKPKGSFFCKILAGPDVDLFVQRCSKLFENVEKFKPRACNDSSREFYIVCRNKKDIKISLKELLKNDQ
ncbi:hypothetical protein ACO0OL_003974 [Hanseniaspora opuntiae]|jgi:21S rRNA (uridine2791-2'-O)-methyltransferase